MNNTVLIRAIFALFFNVLISWACFGNTQTVNEEQLCTALNNSYSKNAIDSDDDGVSDDWEVNNGLNPANPKNTGTIKVDLDDDGMDDVWESENGLDSSDPKDAFCDPDNDKILNLYEYQLKTNPNDESSPQITEFTPQDTEVRFAELLELGHNGGLVVIRMSTGNYNLYYNNRMTFPVDTSFRIMLQGGWNADFSEYDPYTYPTTIVPNNSAGFLELYSISRNVNDRTTLVLDGLQFLQGQTGSAVFTETKGIVLYSINADMGYTRFYCSLHNCSFWDVQNGVVIGTLAQNPSAYQDLEIFSVNTLMKGKNYDIFSAYFGSRLIYISNSDFGNSSIGTNAELNVYNNTIYSTLVEARFNPNSVLETTIKNTIIWEDRLSIYYPIIFEDQVLGDWHYDINIDNSNIFGIFDLENTISGLNLNATTDVNP